MKTVNRFRVLKGLLSFSNILLLISLLSPLQVQALSPMDTKEEPVQLPTGTDPGWWEKIQKDIARSEYQVSWQDQTNIPEIKSAYQAPNRAHNLRTYFTDEGIRVIPRTSDKPEWEWGLSLKAYGPEGDVRPVEAAEIVTDRNRVEYQRGDNLTEWYVNDEKGLEQGFTIKAPLSDPEAGSEHLLTLSLNINGNLHGEINESGDHIEFITSGGVVAVNYGKLHAYDSKGKDLPASMSIMTSDLQIHVDTTGAVYPITIDPLAFTYAWIAESNQAGARFGSSVATAGDVNGDGYSDVIVGAHRYDHGDVGEGRVFVYHGSSLGLNGTYSWTAESNQAYAYFGISAASAGDVNGDGYSDVIVGAYLYDSSESNEGRAFVYYGSSTGLNADPSWTAVSCQADAYFGYSVASAGDVNGDGYSDVIVGAYRYDNGQNREGLAFVYHGSSTGLNADPSWIAQSNQAEASFGFSVASAGDVNGDGYSDVIVGAIEYDNGQTNEGRVFVYHGSSSGLSLSPSWIKDSDLADANFGYSVASAGDINGDGYSDVIVGAPGYYDDQPGEGFAFVYNGSASGLISAPSWSKESDLADAAFGTSVASAGDVNGDGYSDVIVGAPGYYHDQVGEGFAFVYNGSASGLISAPSWSKESDMADAQFGCSIATAGDVNGDGYSDVIVGARNFNNGQTEEGRAYVYHGSSEGLSDTSSWTAESNQTDARFGHSVASAGDVNGDGYSDVIVGAYRYDNGQIREGRVFVYHGSSTGLNAAYSWSAESDQADANFGISVASAGDVNGDGYSDVIIGAHCYINGQINEGRAFVYHGSSSGLNASYSWTAESNKAYAFFGISVSSAGDVNGDGYSDVIVGADQYENDQTYEGRAFVYHGSLTGLSATASWTAESSQAEACFGYSVASAGDVNGDGYSDVIVGAYKYDHGQRDEGRVFVYNGSSSGLNITPSWIKESDDADVYFGHRVATAGDVNGDGYSDVIVGAYRYEKGRAFVYHGSSTGVSATASWTAESDQAYAFFGHSVASAGDVNGDGYSDVIVGAYEYTSDEMYEGRAYVYHGSSTGLNASPSWTAESNQAASNFGYSVASAGDVNGDGYSDVIVGALGYNNGQMYEGRAFVYYGNDGDGFNLKPRQLQANDSAAIPLLGISDSPDSFRIALSGYTPFGRGKVKLQWEVKQVGTLLTGADYEESIEWHDTGTTGAEISELVTGLQANTAYHWQVRFRYSQAATPLQQYSRWFSHAGNGLQETDLRTAKDADEDGLSDIFEADMCTSQDDADTDDDGIIDGDEDINRNGIVDTGETNPCDSDTDNDNIQDGTESGITTGHADTGGTFIPDADGGVKTTNPLDEDTDNDGLLDDEEDTNYNGAVDARETDPADSDTENDNMPDGWEVINDLKPLINDANEDADEDGFKNIMEYRRGTDPQDESSHPSRGMPWLPLLLGD